jgi:hypothetical protein
VGRAEARAAELAASRAAAAAAAAAVVEDGHISAALAEGLRLGQGRGGESLAAFFEARHC